MAAGSKQPPTLYLSYAQKDEALKQEFEDYLVVMQQTQLISGWGERQVQPGTDWSQVVDPHLWKADIVLLLLSPGLLASGYCSGATFREAFERNKTSEKTVLIPIILHRVNLTGHPLETIQILPRNAQPVSSWPERYEAWGSIDREIRSVIRRIQGGAQRTR